jgi:hypothetical protein
MPNRRTRKYKGGYTQSTRNLLADILNKKQSNTQANSKKNVEDYVIYIKYKEAIYSN